MSRVIKFRAWDAVRKEMFQVHPKMLGTHSNGQFYCTVYDHESNEARIPIQQFTGLYDRNGVEVFEGDILETPYEYPGNYHAGDDARSGRYRGRVHYTPSKGFIQRDVIDMDDEAERWEKRAPLDIRSSYTSVIGNIFANPELLEGEKV